MRDILIFGLGLIIGAGGLYALFALHRWVNNLASRVERLRFELNHYSTERELWNEFRFWKQEKGKQ